MAVANPTEPLLASQPDVAELNKFSGHTVTVTKHLAARGTPGKSVVPTQPMKLDDILNLQVRLPLQHGPGYYRFEVADSGGNNTVKWMVSLGPDIQEISPMNSPFGSPVASAAQPAMPLGADVIQIAPGYMYNETLRLLHTPWREVIEWSPGQPFPKPPVNPATTSAAAQTPWNAATQFPPGGWGGYPTNSGDSDRVKALEAQIVEQNRRADLEAQRQETHRLIEDTQRRQDETNKMLLAAIERLGQKPSGPSDELIAMREQLAEMRRQREESDREAQRRADMQAMNDKFDRTIRDLSANKQDPMLPMLMQMMQSNAASASEAVKAIQSSTAAAAQSSERGLLQLVEQLRGTAMSPLQLVQLMQSTKGDAAEGARTIIDAAKESMAMQKTVFEQLLDVASQGGQPAWVTVAQAALDRIGAVGQAIAERQQQQPQQQAPVQQMRQPAQQRMPPAAFQQGPMEAPAVPRRAVGPMTPAEQRAALATGVEHFARRPGDPAPAQMAGAPVNGVVPVSPPTEAVLVEAPAASVVSIFPPETQERRAKSKGGKKKSLPARKNLTGYTGRELMELDPEIVLDTCTQYTDEDFFGMLWPTVQQLRGMKTPDAPTLATYITQARAQAHSAGQSPPAMELFDAEHFDVLLVRLLPDSEEEYRDSVAEELDRAVAVARGEDPDADDDNEGPARGRA